jgi:hypothetical protein
MSIIYKTFTLYLDNSLPVIKPNEPPDTNKALGVILPLDDLNVSSAPSTCIKQLPIEITNITIIGFSLKYKSIKASVDNTKPTREKLRLTPLSFK